jgi:hypothetical protein
MLRGMETGLLLLMRDGPVRIEFSPHLTTSQYDELMSIVQQLSTAATVADLRQEVQAAAQRWGVKVAFGRPGPQPPHQPKS